MKIILYIMIFISSLSNVFGGFIENKGQFPSDVLFAAKAIDCNVWVTARELIMDYNRISKIERRSYGSAISMAYPECSPFLNIEKISAKNEVRNYFSSKKSVSNITEYDTLIIKDLYENIDLRLYFANGFFAYDFILNPNANPELIKIQIDGIDRLDILEDRLLITTPYVSARHENLKTFYCGGGEVIPSSFDYQDNAVKINLEKYDNQKSVVIDPIIFSTFLGGSDFDYSRSMALDSSGNIIVVGSTASLNFPTKIGSYDTTFGENDWGFYDAFVSKFDAAGNLVFSTYIGGYGDDYCEAVAVDTGGNIYLTGYTFSLRDFPFTTRAIDTFDLGGFDMFFTKLNADGDSIIYSTLFGGNGDDFGQALTIDRFNSVYLTGYTKSLDSFRTTIAAYDTSSNGVEDVFVVKLAGGTHSLVYSTFVGGSQADYGQSIAVDNMGNAIVGGITRSTNFPFTPFAFDRTINDSIIDSNTSDGFIFKLNSTGSTMLFSSYLGGKGKDGVYGICLDKSNNIYATGLTESVNFPFIKGAYDSTYNNQTSGAVYGDIFVSKIKHSGDSLIKSTFFGGRGTERGNSVSLDNFGNVYITGTTNSTNFPVSRKAVQTIYQDTNSRTDAFAVKLSQDLDKMSYSTYLGGKHSDVGNSILVLSDLSFYVSGWTSSSDFPISPDAFSTEYGDSAKADVFLARIMPNIIDISFGSDSDSTNRLKNICIGDSVWVGAEVEGGIGAVTYSWSPSFNISEPNEPFTFVKPDVSTNYVLTVTDEMGNFARDTVKVNVVLMPFAEIFGAKLVLTGSEVDYFTPLNATSKYFWEVSQGKILTGQGTYQVRVKWDSTISNGLLSVVETNIGNCSDSASINVIIGKNFSPSITFDGTTTPCAGDTVVLDAGVGYRFYFWSNGATTQEIEVTQSGKYWVSVSDSSGFGGISDTLTFNFTAAPIPIIYGQNVVKPNSLYNYITDKNPGSTFLWIISGGTIQSGQGTDSITVRWNNTISGTLQLEETTLNGCIGRSDFTMIDIGGNFKPKIRILGSANICEGDSVLLDAGYGYSEYSWNNGKKTRFISVSSVDSFFCFVRDIYGFSGWTDTVRVTLLPRPTVPVVTTFGNQFTCNEDVLPIQWYFNNQVIPGANSKQYVADIPGVYKACVKGINGCQSCSELIYYLVSVKDNEEFMFEVFPNPTESKLNIRIENLERNANIMLTNLLGEVVFNISISVGMPYYQTLDLSGLPSGMYLLVLNSGTETTYKRIMKN